MIVNVGAVNLVGYFAFDEGKGTIVTDASSTNINGTVIGASWMVEELYDTLDFVIDTICPTYRKKKYRYGFQGQETDDEVKGEGNSVNYKYRMHDPRVGRWLSVDAMTGKFPSNSPYNGYSNNPIVNIDPDGNADIHFNGKWIGNDGVNDNIVAIATNRKLARNIKRLTRKGIYANEVGLSNGQKNNCYMAIDANVLRESLNVLKKSLKTANTKQEHTAVLSKIDGVYKTTSTNSPEEKTVETSDGGTRSLGGTLFAGDVSIHSHPLGIDNKGNGKILMHDALKPSKWDEETQSGDEGLFEDYELNIIVGKTGKNITLDENDNIDDNRPIEVVLFNNKSELQFTISSSDGAKMDSGKRNIKKKNKFDAKTKK